MRHRRKGRVLGRSPSHQRALLRNLASALFLTERNEEEYLDPKQAPKVKGRIITTLEKAKEVRPLVEKCITLARRAVEQRAAAADLGSTAKRNSEEWKAWKKSDPIQRLVTYLKGQQGQFSDDEWKKMDEEVLAAIERSVAFSEASPFPKPQAALEDIFAD